MKEKKQIKIFSGEANYYDYLIVSTIAIAVVYCVRAICNNK